MTRMTKPTPLKSPRKKRSEINFHWHCTQDGESLSHIMSYREHSKETEKRMRCFPLEQDVR
jgi:hypothetical protein